MIQRSEQLPTRKGVLAAANSIADILPPTPLLPIEINGTRCWVKAENLQPIGAFKIRGAWWRLSNLNEQERAGGVVAVSSGNHAQGIAWVAIRLGIAATIVMPSNAPKVKLEATRSMGAEVITYDRETEDRDKVAAKLIEERTQKGPRPILVHAFADSWVMEGQGSAGVEITAQLGRQPSRIVTCCGGGGLAAGLSLACPDSAIIPVEPFGWDVVGKSLAASEIVQVAENPAKTICDALQPIATKPINLAVLSGRSDPGVAVTDEEVREAQRLAFRQLRLVVEPGGAAALAAALAGKVELDENTVIMLTGGNTDPADFAETITS